MKLLPTVNGDCNNFSLALTSRFNEFDCDINVSLKLCDIMGRKD